MFERFTERARLVCRLAQGEAVALGADHIGTEHLLLGLLREEHGIAAAVLAPYTSLEKVRHQVERIVGQQADETVGPRPFTPRAKKVLELALREALSLGHNYIGTEHILLGLVGENEGVAARLLFGADADAAKIRADVIRMLSGRERSRTHLPGLAPHDFRRRVDAPNFSADDVGEYYLDEAGQVWRLIAWCGSPTATLARIDRDDDRLSGAVGAEIFRGFRKLVPE